MNRTHAPALEAYTHRGRAPRPASLAAAVALAATLLGCARADNGEDVVARADVRGTDGTALDAPQDTASGCPSGLMLCGSICIDTSADFRNCGRCGMICPAGQSCVSGTCMADCVPPRQRCDLGDGPVCVDVLGDPDSCGACGHSCNGGICANGACTCRAGQTMCALDCVDVRTDSSNCGRCGNACNAGMACVGGSCQSTSDPCAGTTSCVLCTRMSMCGWCASSHRCISGVTSGALDGSCSGASWAWGSARCTIADPCAPATNCGTCTSNPACGWCINTMSCHSGTSAGATDHTCSGLVWSFGGSFCP